LPIAPDQHSWTQLWLSADSLRAVAALVGVLSIFLGYRLFCGLSGQKTAERSGLVTNLASGALLALFGMAILVADVHGFKEPASKAQPEWQRKSAQHGPVAPEKIRKPLNSEDRFV
jgi:hypothetical protein